MRALFITYNDINDSFTGGNLCSNRNFKMVSQFYETDVYFVKNDKWSKLKSFFRLYFPPITSKDKQRIEAILREKTYDLVFFNSSLFGKIIKQLNKKGDYRIISFFHNVEYDYISVRFGKKIIKFPYLLAAYWNERNTLKFTSSSIVLNQRDAGRIAAIYQTTPSAIIPITIDDALEPDKNSPNKVTETRKFLLFIGSLNRSNYDAVVWFKDNVMPELNDVDLWVVGKDFETVKTKLEAKNVKIIGTVNQLNDYYTEASAVVSPITHGAGMKVKIAEALMYGKTIFGSAEAFEGYELHPDATILCTSAQDYILKINKFTASNNHKFNPDSRELFNRLYSFHRAVEDFGRIINPE